MSPKLDKKILFSMRCIQQIAEFNLSLSSLIFPAFFDRQSLLLPFLLFNYRRQNFLGITCWRISRNVIIADFYKFVNKWSTIWFIEQLLRGRWSCLMARAQGSLTTYSCRGRTAQCNRQRCLRVLVHKFCCL